jgi:hypothetical protein
MRIFSQTCNILSIYFFRLYDMMMQKYYIHIVKNCLNYFYKHIFLYFCGGFVLPIMPPNGTPLTVVS